MTVEIVEHEGRRHRVGQVGDEGRGREGQVVRLHGQGVVGDEGEAVGPRGAGFGEHRGQVGVALDRNDPAGAREQGHGERADARAHFDHVVDGPHAGKLADAADHVVVD